MTAMTEEPKQPTLRRMTIEIRGTSPLILARFPTFYDFGCMVPCGDGWEIRPR